MKYVNKQKIKEKNKGNIEEMPRRIRTRLVVLLATNE